MPDNIMTSPALQSPNFTEHIRPGPTPSPIQGDIKAYQDYVKHKYFPEPPLKKTRKKTAKAIVGLDVIEVPHCLEQYWPLPTEAVKQQVRERDHYTCQICGEWGNVVDHINPLRISHDSSLENLRVLCQYCNIITRMKRRDARLDFEAWSQLLKESVESADINI